MSKKTEDLKTRLLEFHNKKIAESEHVLMGDDQTVCFDYFINVSGTEQLIPKLDAIDKEPSSQMIYKVPAGRRMNLNTIWSIGTINRQRDQLLPLFTTMRSMLDPDYPAFLLVSKEDLQIDLGFDLEKKSLVERMKEKGQERLELGINEYDIRLQEVIEKEEKSNAKASEKLGIGNKNRKTKAQVENEI